jgi:hypothetical protein
MSETEKVLISTFDEGGRFDAKMVSSNYYFKKIEVIFIVIALY